MGWSTLTDMPELFVPAVKKLRAGQVSVPLRAGNGFHILKLFSTKRSQGKITKNQVEQQLRQRKFQENLSLWLQQLRDSAYIKIMVPGYKSLESAEHSS
jgi:peptidyl-prolyl cis-trans isomerase SurA